MPYVPGVGSVPPTFDATPKIGTNRGPEDFGRIIDKLAAPQGTSGPEFPDLIKPAPTLADPQGARNLLLGPQSRGPISEAGRVFKPLADFVGEVNATALYSAEMQQAFASGEDVALHDVMIASEKSGVAIQLATQLRNKLLEAYQEISRMQV